MKIDILNLHVSANGKEIIKGTDLSMKSGEFHVLMGPNGSGKTTLAMALMGYPQLQVTSGDIRVDDKSILGMPANERAKLGLFMQFQDPPEVDGVGIINFLMSAKSALSQNKIDARTFMNEVTETAEKMHMQKDIVGRSLNFGFSGGEKKKSEILQMQLLEPKFVLLDEPDSGLDVDALKDVANVIKEFAANTGAGMLLITHYTRILRYLEPDYVHVLVDGKIVKSGGPELAEYIDKNGYTF